MTKSTGLKPLVSIIVNNFNYEQFIRQAIDSALQQTYSPVEVIVVDDGSTDQSRTIIQKYAEYITPVFKENQGQASALNSGFRISQGDIIVFLDSDDLLLPSMAQDVVNVFLSQPEVVRVQYKMAVIDENGNRTGAEKPEKHIPVPNGDVRQQVLKFPFDMAWLPTSGNAFSSKALGLIMPIPEESYKKVDADWYLIHLSSLLGPISYLNSLEACYRVHRMNNYEQADTLLNLDHIRHTIQACQITSTYIQQYAKKFGMVDAPAEITSVSYIANRLVSLCVDPLHHPIFPDTRLGLIKLGIRASSQRFDVSIILKFLFIIWFFLMALSPRPLGRVLARQFLFPQARYNLNSLLGLLHVQPKSL